MDRNQHHRDLPCRQSIHKQHMSLHVVQRDWKADRLTERHTRHFWQCWKAAERTEHGAQDWIGLSSVLRPRQHSIGYMGDGFYRSKDPTNSIKVLKEQHGAQNVLVDTLDKSREEVSSPTGDVIGSVPQTTLVKKRHLFQHTPPNTRQVSDCVFELEEKEFETASQARILLTGDDSELDIIINCSRMVQRLLTKTSGRNCGSVPKNFS